MRTLDQGQTQQGDWTLIKIDFFYWTLLQIEILVLRNCTSPVGILNFLFLREFLSGYAYVFYVTVATEQVLFYR
jgi:hypothetical protein